LTGVFPLIFFLNTRKPRFMVMIQELFLKISLCCCVYRNLSIINLPYIPRGVRMRITIKTPKTRDDFKAYYDLRYRVLREPWGQAKDTEKDDYEPISQHFMAVDEDKGKIVGVIKVFERSAGVGWVSHLAVDPAYQKKGIGKQLLAAVEQAARESGWLRQVS